MNPFIYPEFWLSFAFLLVIGLVIFSPIRQKIRLFTNHHQQTIQDQITNSNALYTEARHAYHQTLKETKTKQTDPSMSSKVKALKDEFLQKEQARILAQTQDFQTRQNLTLSQTKNHLRTHLLNETEKGILKSHSSSKAPPKEIAHFITALKENQKKLNDSLKNAL